MFGVCKSQHETGSPANVVQDELLSDNETVLSEQSLSVQKLFLRGLAPEWQMNLRFVQIEEWMEAFFKRKVTIFSPTTSNPFQGLTQGL